MGDLQAGNNKKTIMQTAQQFVFLLLVVSSVPGLVQQASGQMILFSDAFKNGERLPVDAVCDRQERDQFAVLSPQLRWVRPPVKTRSFVLVMDDVATQKLHWAVKDIPAGVDNLVQDATETNLPRGAVELLNSFNATAYVAPCPLSEERTYRFRLFAMPSATYTVRNPNMDLIVPVPQSSADLVADLQKSALYVAVLTATAYLDPPLPPVEMEASLSAPVGSYVRVYTRDQPLCHFDTPTLESIIVQLVSITPDQTVLNGTDLHTMLIYRLVNPGVKIINFQLVCSDLDSPPLVIRLRLGSLPSRHPSANVNVTSSIVLSRDRPPFRPRQEKYRFVKPSEVIKPKRKHVDLEPEFGGNCIRVSGADECLTEFQNLAEVDASNNTLIGDFENSTVANNNTAATASEASSDCAVHFSHAGRTPEGEICEMSIAMPDASCDVSGFQIDDKYGCGTDFTLATARNFSIPISWTGLPQGAVSVVVLVEDGGHVVQDSRNLAGSVHWLVTDIDARKYDHLDAGASGTHHMPELSVELMNSFDKPQFAGLCAENSPRREARVWKIRVFAMPHARSFLHLHNIKQNHHTHHTHTQPQHQDQVQQQADDDGRVKASVIVQQLRAQALCSASLSMPVTFAAQQQQQQQQQQPEQQQKQQQQEQVATDNDEGGANEDSQVETTAAYQVPSKNEMNVRITEAVAGDDNNNTLNMPAGESNL